MEQGTIKRGNIYITAFIYRLDMGKKGQVTVFIIIGILLVLVLGITFFLVQKIASAKLQAKTEQPLALRKEPLQQAVEKCVQDSLERAVFFISGQGGYYQTPPPYFEFAVFKIPYYFDQQILAVPTTAEIEKNLAEFIVNDFAGCKKELAHFPQKITIDGEPKVQVSLFPATIRATVSLPLRLHLGEDIVTVDTFQAKLPSELSTIIEVRDLLLHEQEKYPAAVRLSELVQLAERRHLLFTLENVEGTVLYQLGGSPALPSELSNPELPNQKKLLFTFAIRYPWNEPLESSGEKLTGEEETENNEKVSEREELKA